MHHQSSPFPTRIWLPPFAEPIAPRVPALMSRDGEHDRHGHRAQRSRSAARSARPTWAPASTRGIPATSTTCRCSRTSTRSGPRRRSTATRRRTSTRSRDYPAQYARPAVRVALPEPVAAAAGGDCKDAVDYMLTASLSVLDYAAKYKETLLYNRYQSGRDQIRRYQQEPPYAYVIPQQQRDPVAPVELLRRLAFNGVRGQPADRAVPRSTASPIPRGTWVIPMNQEFARAGAPAARGADLSRPARVSGRAARAAVRRGRLDAAAPDGRDGRGREDAADAPRPRRSSKPLGAGAGATAGARGDDDAAPFDSVPGAGFDASPLAAAIVPPAGRITGSGPALGIDRAQNNAVPCRSTRRGRRARRVRVDAAQVGAIRGDRYARWRSAPPGRIAGAAGRERPPRAAPSCRGRASACISRGIASMDAGWTQWLLENYGFDFATVRPADVKAGAPRPALRRADSRRRERPLAARRLSGRAACRRRSRAASAPRACRRSSSSSATAARSCA